MKEGKRDVPAALTVENECRKILAGKLKGRDNVRDLGLHGRIILK
jgi:hypothetical protein